MSEDELLEPDRFRQISGLFELCAATRQIGISDESENNQVLTAAKEQGITLDRREVYLWRAQAVAQALILVNEAQTQGLSLRHLVRIIRENYVGGRKW